MKWVLTVIVLYALQLTAFGATHEEEAVAAVLMGEAWSDGVPGMTAVAEVIHQRAVEKKESPWQVITAHRGKVHAFSSLNRNTPEGLIEHYRIHPDFQKALGLARMICEVPSELPGITMSANHFTQKTEHPYWARGHHPVAIIGHHAFYRLAQY